MDPAGRVPLASAQMAKHGDVHTRGGPDRSPLAHGPPLAPAVRRPIWWGRRPRRLANRQARSRSWQVRRAVAGLIGTGKWRNPLPTASPPSEWPTPTTKGVWRIAATTTTVLSTQFTFEVMASVLYFASLYSTSGWSVLTVVHIAGAVVILPPLVWDLLQLAVWRRAELLATHPSLRLGEQTVVSYWRQPRRAGAMLVPASGTVEARLVCREAVRAPNRRSHQFITRDVVDVPVRAPGITSKSHFVAGLGLEVPLDAGGPTLRSARVQINWLLLVRVRRTRWLPPSSPASFRLVVSTALAPNAAALTDRTDGDQAPKAAWQQHGSWPASAGAESAMTVIVANPIVEPGGMIRVALSYNPALDTNVVTAVEFDLSFEIVPLQYDPRLTAVVKETIPLDTGAIVSLEKEYQIPEDAPISYEGEHVNVRWRLHVIGHRAAAQPHRVAFDIDVVPTGAVGLYREPHPYRRP